MDIIEIAHAWSSVMTWNDPGVTMYAFASTGRVQSEAHRADLLRYIEKNCRAAATLNEAADEDDCSHEELDELEDHIRSAPVEPA